MERNTAKRTLEKLLSVCICLCMLGAMLPAQVFAEEADTAQTETVQDTAPKDTVYLSSADDLIQELPPGQLEPEPHRCAGSRY
mgnify:CR=1 FL=1